MHLMFFFDPTPEPQNVVLIDTVFLISMIATLDLLLSRLPIAALQ